MTNEQEFLDNLNHSLATEVVEADGSYSVRVYADIELSRIHLMDYGPLATRELAEDLAEHMMMKGEGEEEVIH